MNAIKKIVMGLAVASAAVFCSAADIYVATTGHDDTGDGSSGNPYETIAKGITEAKAAITGGEASATVHVADSETAYAAPNATLDAAIAVVGNPEHPENVVIDDATAGKRAFTLSHADAKVAGVTITGAGYKTAGGSGGHISMSKGTVEDCIIEGGRASANSGQGRGGNVFMSGGCLRRCIVRNGKAADSTSNGNCRGANIYATGGVVENCLVTGGSAQTENQSSFDVDGATVRVVNCTIVGNSCTGTSTANIYSGLRVYNDKAQVVNCVIYGNGGTAAKEWGNTRAGCFINCAVASGAAITGGTDNIDTVTEDAFKDYANGDYRPKMGVLVDAGVSENDYVNTYGATSMTDLAGGERVAYVKLDIGAYEFQQGGFLAGGGASIYSTGTGNPVTFTAMSVGAEGEVSYLWDFGDGTTSGWTTEATVTHAFALAGDHVVSVKAKTEEQGESAAFILPHGAIHTVPADIYVDSENGNDETGDGTSAKPLATLTAAYALAKSDRGELSQDVTVRLADGTYAAANMTLDVPFAVVGNVADPSQVTINDATAGKRAFTLSHADAKVAGVTITGAGYKTANGSGGHILMSAGTVEDCIIEGGRAAPSAVGKGGNVSMSGGCLRRCVVRNGRPADSTTNGNCRGANIHATGGVVENCLVTGGAALTDQTSSFDVNGATKVINCTIINNTPGSKFGGIHLESANAQAVNCVIYGNGGTAQKEWGSANPKKFVNCAFAAGLAPTEGAACIDTVTSDAFKDYANGDYRPEMGVLVDAGVSENDYVNTYGATSMTDLAGGVRVIRDNLDIGAYEFQQGGFLAGGVASIYSTGTGTPVTFTAMSVGAEGEVSYLWDFGDGTTSGWTTEATVTHAYALAGDHEVSVKAKTEEQGESAAFILPHSAIHTVPADIYVDSENGNDETGDGTSAKPLATLTAAYALAKNSRGELAWNVTVHLADGTYDAANMALNVPFAVVGNADDPSQVTINDATAGKRAFTLSHADAKVAGVTITGAGYKTAGGSGGHILMSAGTVEDCIIEGGRASANSGAGKGGNVSMSGGCLRRCIVRNGKPADSTTNGTSRGANIHATGGVVENCLVTGGSALTDQTSSFDVSGATKVINCTIVKNTPGSKFGGIHLESADAQAVNCVIYGNGGTAQKEWGNTNPKKFVNCAFAAGLAPTEGTACIATVTEDAFAGYKNGDYRLPKGDSVLKGAGVTKKDYLGYGATSETDLIGTLWGKTLDIGCYAAKAAGLMLILR